MWSTDQIATRRLSTKSTTNTSDSTSPPSPLDAYDFQDRDRRLESWLRTSAHPTNPPSHARDCPHSEVLVRSPNEADAEYDWLVAYLSSYTPVSSAILADTIPKLQQDAIKVALINAVAEILYLSGQLDERISTVCAPSLRIRVTREMMYRCRDRHWHFTPDTIRSWSDEEKVECLKAARLEIRWLKVECMNLDHFVWDRQAEVESGGVLDETSYVPSAT